MIRRSQDKKMVLKENSLGVEGRALVRSLLNSPDEMYGKGRVFSHSTLQPGASIAYHVHQGESETYYIYHGTAEFNDNGTMTVLQSGDVAFTGAGEGHGIKNIGDEALDMIVLILYQ